MMIASLHIIIIIYIWFNNEFSVFTFVPANSFALNVFILIDSIQLPPSYSSALFLPLTNKVLIGVDATRLPHVYPYYT